FAVQEVISSPWERCAATVAPYAQVSEDTVVHAPEITEKAAKKRPGGVRALVDDLLARPREATVVCTHRPVLPFVLEAVAKRSPHRVSKKLPKENPYLRTAEVLVIHMAQREHRRARVVAAELPRPHSGERSWRAGARQRAPRTAWQPRPPRSAAPAIPNVTFCDPGNPERHLLRPRQSRTPRSAAPAIPNANFCGRFGDSGA